MVERKFFVETAVGKNEVADYLLAIKHDARATTFNYIKNITEEELDWQPYPGWNSVAALLAHIVAIDHYFRIIFIEGRDFTEQEEREISPGLDLGKFNSTFKGKPVEYYREQLQTSYEQTQKAIAGMDAGTFFKRRYDDYDKVKGSDMAWILFHGAEDEVHHRGQISIIRKLYKEMKGKQP